MKRKTQSTLRRKNLLLLLVVVVLLAVAAAGLLWTGASSSAEGTHPAATTVEGDQAFPGHREDTETLLAYNRSIDLTPEQHEVYREALDGLRAPCCDQYSAATCCCECNMARATWGLAKHLVVEKGYDADGVRTAVADWFDTVNPDGFTGDACFTGGCGRSFARNGCGGMREDQLVF